MIRILNDTHCQVLHRKTTHEVMMQAIADIVTVKPVAMLDALLEFETLTLEDMLVLIPVATELKHPKLTLLILIAGEYSYFDGMYRRRKHHSETGLEAYSKVKTFVTEYLSKL